MGEARTYLTIYFAGISGLFVYNMGSGILRAVGDARRPVYILIPNDRCTFFCFPLSSTRSLICCL